jgi:hypothetical protein
MEVVGGFRDRGQQGIKRAEEHFVGSGFFHGGNDGTSAPGQRFPSEESWGKITRGCGFTSEINGVNTREFWRELARLIILKSSSAEHNHVIEALAPDNPMNRSL